MKATLGILLILSFFSCGQALEKQPHIVFLMAEEEYRSEESMPMLAEILKRDYNARITLCYSIDSAGYIDPNRSDYISNLDSLATADLAVFFLRFRELPIDQLKQITDYVESGKPMVGFRTSTHSFLYKSDSTLFSFNDEWPTKVFGQQWITHHGHFEDGNAPLTHVSIPPPGDHPILRGVESFDAYSWLYHVDGGAWSLESSCEPFMQGKSLRSKHQENNRLDQYALENPIAWTKPYISSSGDTSRVFFTTLGHPYDFKNPSMRTLALNGILWALDKENDIPIDGCDPTLTSPYDPNNSGFGKKYKLSQKPIIME